MERHPTAPRIKCTAMFLAVPQSPVVFLFQPFSQISSLFSDFFPFSQPFLAVFLLFWRRRWRKRKEWKRNYDLLRRRRGGRMRSARVHMRGARVPFLFITFLACCSQKRQNDGETRALPSVEWTPWYIFHALLKRSGGEKGRRPDGWRRKWLAAMGTTICCFIFLCDCVRLRVSPCNYMHGCNLHTCMFVVPLVHTILEYGWTDATYRQSDVPLNFSYRDWAASIDLEKEDYKGRKGAAV